MAARACSNGWREAMVSVLRLSHSFTEDKCAVTRKDAVAYARRESHNKKIRVISWWKENVKNGDKKGHEIAILVWAYETKADWRIDDGPHTWTRLKVFIDGSPRYGDYID
jgi:hypothetical protein